MHNDLTTWSFILALAALVLTLPLAILGTLLTPRVEDWWAKRSERSLTKRINKLETKLASLDGKTPLTEIEEKILEALDRTIFIFGYLIASVILLIYRSTNSPYVHFPGFGLDRTVAIEASIVMGAAVVALGLPVRNLRKQRSVEYREALRTRIEQLRQRTSH